MLLPSSSTGGPMGSARAEIDIDTPPDEVWAVVGDFGGVASWMPGVESCHVDGDDRFIKMMGIEVVEGLRRRDVSARVIEYGIVGGVPVGNHLAAITVEPSGEGSHVTWEVEVEPDEMTDMFRDVYQQSLQALKDHLTT
jgi:mxaD protein